MSTLQRVKLADIAYVGSSAGSVYPNPSGKTTLVCGLVLFNGNTTTELVKVYVVPNSSGSLGTAGAGNQIVEISLAAKETLLLDIPFSITLTGTNDSIQASTTTASKVTVIVVGDQVA